MNSCILMAEIIKDPELRYTSDNQTPIAEMLVQFPSLRAEDPPATLKVVGWGNLAQEIQERYHQGEYVVIEGRLTMNTIERPEGFKEKRAELTASRIHPIGATTNFESSAPASATTSNKVVAFTPPSTAAVPSEGAYGSRSLEEERPELPKTTRNPTPSPRSPEGEKDLDDIPF